MHIPESVTKIGEYAFEECMNLQEFTCSKKNGILNNKDCSEVLFAQACENAIIEESTDIIGEYAFYYNENVK